MTSTICCHIQKKWNVIVIDEQMAQLDNAIEFLWAADKSQLTKKQIRAWKEKNETKLTNLLDRER